MNANRRNAKIDGIADVRRGIQSCQFCQRKQGFFKRDKDVLEKLVKKRSEKLVELNSELERAKRLSDIGTLAEIVAHELRNPLSAILLANHNIRRKSQHELINKHLATIDKKVTESEEIINNLLFYSRLKAPDFANIQIYEILDNCIDNIQKQSKKNIEVKRCYDPIKGIFIDADPLQMREAFHNILSNACDAVSDSDGQIEISALNIRKVIKIYFKDNGEGINKDILEKVFEPFFTTKARGIGLGLSICNSLITMHDGTIQIENSSGKGTTLIVTLPKKRHKQVSAELF